ncbi:MAG TPA: triose-phosphate isomerase [Candidatus Taylorbacteria bacterium]|nr:MAG: Triosephosphate isomerase [Parcubacteria group bacterium GW2011_GWF2_50_9]HCB35202.1 triose-phosphate isomerase [Candidatus Taylorbacteria bacterium]
MTKFCSTIPEDGRIGGEHQTLAAVFVIKSAGFCYNFPVNKKKLIVANWKMNPGSVSEARALFGKTKRAGGRLEKVETVICPPFPYLGMFARTGTARVFLGAQDVFWANSARATGEVSPEMLKHLGVIYCIIGHSERRALGETDDSVSKKLRAVLAERLIPIVCVGEKERDTDGRYFETLKSQILASFSGVTGAQLRGVCVAYEPLWAIGKSAKDAMEPRGIHEMAIFIHKVLFDQFGEGAERPRILYGGSVEEKNAGSILVEGGVSGLLVGHASLDGEGFAKMLRVANAV